MAMACRPRQRLVSMSAESKAGEPTLRYYVNTGEGGSARVHRAILSRSKGNLQPPRYTPPPPRLADFNNDGLIDIAMSAGNDVCLLENVGSPRAPKFRLRSEKRWRPP